MRKAGELGFLGVAVPEAYGGMGMGFVSTLLACDYISSATGSLVLPLVHIQVLELCQLPYMVQKNKNKNTFLN